VHYDSKEALGFSNWIIQTIEKKILKNVCFKKIQEKSFLARFSIFYLA